ncbi:helix-turn-helix domain-containing protein [Nonomuraea sp. NPDC049655]|uniref:helix-turn-helix domain-containing protein n=1 Tax=Nonomuraea sp. NPDC049655 TaxID=3364355 RepID=UPI003787B2A0
MLAIKVCVRHTVRRIRPRGIIVYLGGIMDRREIRRRRKILGMRQEDLAKDAGVSTSMISHLENGRAWSSGRVSQQIELALLTREGRVSADLARALHEAQRALDALKAAMIREARDRSR